jgi:hypothetical protein
MLIFKIFGQVALDKEQLESATLTIGIDLFLFV